MNKVVKFGGSSLASAEQFKKVGKIISDDKDRHFVVPSAPGKRFSKDKKVTDMLYSCYANVTGKGGLEKMDAELADIKARYTEIIEGLSLKLSLDDEFKTIRENFVKKAGKDYAASRGEYLNGIIMADYLGYEFIDAAEVIKFNADGEFDSELTNKVLSEKLKTCVNAVIPGFYGSLPDGTIKTYPAFLSQIPA